LTFVVLPPSKKIDLVILLLKPWIMRYMIYFEVVIELCPGVPR
jgi:hypothetical protein